MTRHTIIDDKDARAHAAAAAADAHADVGAKLVMLRRATAFAA